MKNEKMKWYVLIAVALVVGGMVGYFATNSLSTTGNANKFIQENTGQGVVAIRGITRENCHDIGGNVIPPSNNDPIWLKRCFIGEDFIDYVY